MRLKYSIHHVLNEVMYWLLFGSILFSGAMLVYATVVDRDEPRITGGSGYLKGIQVLDREGRRLCDSPFYSDERKITTCE